MAFFRLSNCSFVICQYSVLRRSLALEPPQQVLPDLPGGSWCEIDGCPPFFCSCSRQSAAAHPKVPVQTRLTRFSANRTGARSALWEGQAAAFLAAAQAAVPELAQAPALARAAVPELVRDLEAVQAPEVDPGVVQAQAPARAVVPEAAAAVARGLALADRLAAARPPTSTLRPTAMTPGVARWMRRTATIATGLLPPWIARAA
jgi:hypothetical protein